MAIETVDNSSPTSGDLNNAAWSKYNATVTALLLKHDSAGSHIESDILTLLGLTSVEVDQVGNIGAVTISATQWSALGALVEWTDWTPTLTGGADLSGYNYARYYRIGDICFFSLTVDGKNVTTAGAIQITLPFTCANTGHKVPAGVVYDGTTWINVPYMYVRGNTNYIELYKDKDGGNWIGNETGITIYLTGFFEIA